MFCGIHKIQKHLRCLAGWLFHNLCWLILNIRYVWIRWHIVRPGHIGLYWDRCFSDRNSSSIGFTHYSYCSLNKPPSLRKWQLFFNSDLLPLFLPSFLDIHKRKHSVYHCNWCMQCQPDSSYCHGQIDHNEHMSVIHDTHLVNVQTFGT